MKKYIFLILIIVFALALRVWQLNTLPFGVENDEVSYIYSAYTVWQTGGHDIAGKFLPLSINLDSSLSPVPVYITAPFVGLFGLSPLTGRLPFALAGVGSVILVYFLAKVLFKNEYIGLFSSFVMAVSPWHILISRGAWDGDFAVFFYLLGTYLFLKFLEKGNILWSLPAFLLGFYSYHGTKLFFLFFIPMIIIIYHKDLLKKKKIYSVFVACCITILLSFFLVLKTQSVTRQSAFAWSDHDTITAVIDHVNFNRQKSAAPNVLKDIVTNKPTALAAKIISNYLGAFSTQFLFLTGDQSIIYGYGVFFKGVMYLIEFPLLIFGIIFLAKEKEKKSVLLVATGLLLAPLPAALGPGTAYLIHANNMIPFLSLIVGCGIYYVFHQTQKRKMIFIISTLSIVLGYILCIGLFLYQYVFQFNVFGGEFWNKSNRDAAMVIQTNFNHFDHIYVAAGDDKFLFQFLFFNNVDPHVFQKVWQTEKNVRVIGKTTFFASCLGKSTDNPLDLLPHKTLYLAKATCYSSSNPTTQITDSLEPLRIIWSIYEKN